MEFFILNLTYKREGGWYDKKTVLNAWDID